METIREEVEQARAWREVYDLCRELGMPPFEHATGVGSVTSFIRRMRAALAGVLDGPDGCSLCDSGKPRNPEKGHQPDCPYEVARAVLAQTSESE